MVYNAVKTCFQTKVQNPYYDFNFLDFNFSEGHVTLLGLGWFH